MTVATDVVITQIDGTGKVMVTITHSSDKHEQTLMADDDDNLYKLAIEHHGRTKN